jgi:hypothetical protein
MASYGGINPAAENIRFPYAAALEAAQDMWALGKYVREKYGDREPLAEHAREEWHGPHRDTFNGHMADEKADAGVIASGLEQLAKDLAQQWRKARGEQDRINWARFVEAKLDDDGTLENAWEWFAGENEDYKDVPKDPDPPQPPHFEPTAKPAYPEFGP